MGKRADIAGQQFGRLCVAEPARRYGKHAWLCYCVCGNYIIVPTQWLKTGDALSCGCLKREYYKHELITHGMSSTATYRSWYGMRTRCSNPNQIRFKYYGGRGVSVCKRWKQFENFLADMGERPPGMTLDRIKNHLHYTPDNCRWATPKEQRANRRSIGMKRIIPPLDSSRVC